MPGFDHALKALDLDRARRLAFRKRWIDRIVQRSRAGAAASEYNDDHDDVHSPRGWRDNLLAPSALTAKTPGRAQPRPSVKPAGAILYAVRNATRER
jgi:hypothetical protein